MRTKAAAVVSSSTGVLFALIVVACSSTPTETSAGDSEQAWGNTAYVQYCPAKFPGCTVEDLSPNRPADEQAAEQQLVALGCSTPGVLMADCYQRFAVCPSAVPVGGVSQLQRW